MKYKDFYVETGTEALTDAVVNHGKGLGYKPSLGERRLSRINRAVCFYTNGLYETLVISSCRGEKLSIQDFFKLTKEDVIMQEPIKEIKSDLELLHRLDDFFTKLLAGEVEIEDRKQGLCQLLYDNDFDSCEIFNDVIDVTEWEFYSGNKNHPVRLGEMCPIDAFRTHEDKWDKKHPYGRNRWKFVEWCHEQVKAQIEQEDIEFPVLAENIHNGSVVLFTGRQSGVICDNKDPYCYTGKHSNSLKDITNTAQFKILKTAKELGLTLRGEK